jgi:hypothetical protein
MTENNIDLTIDNPTVKAVVNQIKSDMRGRGKYAAYVAEFGVTRESVKDHALALARLVTPETAQKKDGVRTRFGNAVQAAGNGLRSVLDKDDTPKPITLRVSLSGEGGGTVTIDPSDPLYATLVRKVKGDDAAQAA